MSYRDLFKFSETMRSLGFHRQIPIDSFHNSNFSLMAQVLIWLSLRFEPESTLLYDIETPDQRVYFIRTIAEFFALKANVKLNVKKLYQADRNAIGELLKITDLLNDALRSKITYNNKKEISKFDTNLYSKNNELKKQRELAVEITIKGSQLYQSLEEETELRPIREKCLNAFLDIGDMEQSLKSLIEKTKNKTEETKNLIKNITSTKENLDTKIAKRREDLDRNLKRLNTLKQVRPAFLEEFEDLESELRILYQEYILRQRCINYLENQQEQAAHIELMRMKEQQELAKNKIKNNKLDDEFKILDEDNEHNLLPEKVPGSSNESINKDHGMFSRLTDSETDSDLMLDDEDSNLLASDADLSTSKAEKSGSVQSDSDN
ncbi:clusterin-associated protein 1 [Daktulosphaira vitifoliae]|uniref:clusterin-associated protein 1 n=1 Tax=Daktulosphaira vitifoliae TaxID=58002 RepID=UPI0021AAEE88|nr:clusterin-associated protein 1 [Daktulosphaira vitifoliae]XP_050543978.1 clusterin-associated protein 1 [Daktulosphaira vitifoliae]